MLPRIRLPASLIRSTTTTVLIMALLCFQRLNIAHGLSSSARPSLEAFSVAPMMAHTNRHYRYMFRQLSENAHLYTEMIPASQIVQVFELLVATTTTSRTTIPAMYNNPDDLLEIVHSIRRRQQQQQPQHAYTSSSSLDIKFFNLLHELIDEHKDPQIALQLGGRDPGTLQKATAIATAFGYQQINLNCGCPSSSVASGKNSGAALMREPELVATCLEAMSNSMPSKNSLLSVKHRLGVANADTYNANWDHSQDDQAAYESCQQFCKLITMAGKVSKIQIHARLALLGLGTTTSASSSDSNNNSDKTTTALWTPAIKSNQMGSTAAAAATKVDHKRAQYFAKRQARQATIDNRSVPPLRPKVVDRIAEEYSHLEIISNGGVQSMTHIQDRLANNQVTGVMVGRSAINHPCSFAQVDSLLSWNSENSQEASATAKKKPSRQHVLQTYIEYCEKQEAQMMAAFPDMNNIDLQDFRKKLVAVPFHLFMGEDGNNIYQRRLRKLNSRGHRHSAASMLVAAMREVPTDTLEKSVEDYVPWDAIETFDFTKRSGAMQRIIY